MRLFSEQVVVIEHESHFRTVAVDLSDAFSEGPHQIVDGLEQHVGGWFILAKIRGRH